MKAEFIHYRPRSEKAQNPDSFADRDLFKSVPLFGIDGGVLIPDKLVQDTSTRDPLITFLQSRTLPIPDTIVSTTSSPDGSDLKLHRSRYHGEWRSSRGATYYNPNFGFEPYEDKKERRRNLTANLRNDAIFISKLPRVQKTLEGLSDEDRARATIAVFQIITADLSGLRYAYEIASRFSESLKPDAERVTREVEAAFTRYYKNISEPSRATISQSDLKIVSPGASLLDKTRGITPDHIDDIRTQRESDAGYLTLGAAKSFIKEFGLRGPHTITPLLGAYDLGPALKALGYKSEVSSILPAMKLLDTRIDENGHPRREKIPQDLHPDSLKIRGSDVAIFDDSLGRGRTLLQVMGDLAELGTTPKAIRTQFLSDTLNPQPLSFLKVYGDIFEAYYASLIRKPSSNRRNDSHAIYPRSVTKRWIAQGQKHQPKY